MIPPMSIIASAAPAQEPIACTSVNTGVGSRIWRTKVVAISPCKSARAHVRALTPKIPIKVRPASSPRCRERHRYSRSLMPKKGEQQRDWHLDRGGIFQGNREREQPANY